MRGSCSLRGGSLILVLWLLSTPLSAQHLLELPAAPNVSVEALLGLSGVEAFSRLLGLPSEVARALREPAPLSRKLPEAPSPSAPLTGPVLAGAAACALELPESLRGLPQGGTAERLHPIWDPAYDPHHVARLLSPSRGVRDAVRAKALVLSAGGKRIAWISVDSFAVTEDLVCLVKDELASRHAAVDLLLVSATHTHSGPGEQSSSKFLWIASDVYRAQAAGEMARWMARAVERAIAGAAPAELGWGAFEVSGLVLNRRDPAGPAAKTFRLLKVVRPGGAPVAALVLGPIHGTVLPSSNLLLSADIAGALERALEARLGGGAVAMLVQGAEGDQSPLVAAGEAPGDALDRLGGELARRAAEAFSATPSSAETVLDWSSVRWFPGPVSFHPGLMLKWLPRELVLPIGPLLESDGPLTALRIGATTVLTVPAEPILELGGELSAAAVESGDSDVAVCGLTNGYLGYVTTPGEYFKGGYEAMMTFYGARESATLLEAAKSALEELAPAGRSRSSAVMTSAK